MRGLGPDREPRLHIAGAMVSREGWWQLGQKLQGGALLTLAGCRSDIYCPIIVIDTRGWPTIARLSFIYIYI